MVAVLLVVGLSACKSTDYTTGGSSPESGSVTFAINSAPALSGEVTEQSTTRAQATDPKPITRLWHAIIDSQGKAVEIRTQSINPDLSGLIIEGLADGNYSIVFLATTGDVAADAIDKLDQITEQWLVNGASNAPLDEDYLYRRVDFQIDHNNPPQVIPIELQRISGRVELDIKADNPQSLRFITNIEITYNEGSSVRSEMMGDGTYTGQMTIRDFDITTNRGFYSLPSIGKLSGVVRITATTTDDQLVVSEHNFTNSQITSGIISKIAIDYTHPEDNVGSFRVQTKDYTPDNSLLMLQDDEPREVFYDNSQRYFYVHEPLQVSVNQAKELQIRFYSALPIKDTKILIRFKKYSPEFFELAHYDEILPYQESRVPIPIVSKARTFRSQDGRNVKIPAYPNLSAADCELKIVSDDPYMQKVSTITCRWYIRFYPFSADAPDPGNWRHMTPALCREGVVLATNMAFMFASSEFETEMERKKADGTFFYNLKDSSSNPIQHSVIMNKIKNHSGLNMGAVGNVNGLGGDATYGLASWAYYNHYWDAAPPANFHKSTAYHELGHCIGYGHSSTMTYGDQWTVLCSRVMFDLGQAGKLPVNSKWVLNTSNSTEIPELPDDEDDDHEEIL